MMLLKEKTPTQDFLIQTIISEVISYIMKEKNLSLIDAFEYFYKAKISEKLENIDTGLYLEGASYFYQLVKEELEKKNE